MSPISNSNCSLLACVSLISSSAGFTVKTFLAAGKETTITYYQFKINLKYRGSSRQRPLAGKGEDKVEPNAKFTKFLLKFTSVVPFPPSSSRKFCINSLQPGSANDQVHWILYF